MQTAADIFSQLNGLRLSDGTSAGERLRTVVTPPSLPTRTPSSFNLAVPRSQQLQTSGKTSVKADAATPSHSSPPPYTKSSVSDKPEKVAAETPGKTRTVVVTSKTATSSSTLTLSNGTLKPLPASLQTSTPTAAPATRHVPAPRSGHVLELHSPALRSSSGTGSPASLPESAAAVVTKPAKDAAVGITTNGSTRAAAVATSLRSPIAGQLKAVFPAATVVTSPVKPVQAVPTESNTTRPTFVAVTGETLNPKVLEFFHNARGWSLGTESTKPSGKPPLPSHAAAQVPITQSIVPTTSSSTNGAAHANSVAATRDDAAADSVVDTNELRTKIASAVAAGGARVTPSSLTATQAPSHTEKAAQNESRHATSPTLSMAAAVAANAFLCETFGDKELMDNTTAQKPLIRRLPSLPADGRYIVVGDVHGCVEQLEALVAKVKYVPGKDCLVIIGDYVNKGPDSIGVVRACQRLKAVGVLGNHDYTLLKCCARQRRKPFCPDDLRDPVKRLAKNLPLDCEVYLRSLPHMLRLPAYNVLLVHAGLNPEHAIEDQSVIEIMHLRRLEKVCDEGGDGDKALSRADPARNRCRERYNVIVKGQAGAPWAQFWNGPEHVVFGHDAYAGFQSHPHATGIDTGCVYGDPLTCVVFSAATPHGEFYSVPGLPRHANELMGLPPPSSDIYEQLQTDLARHIIRPTTRPTPAQLGPASPCTFASTPVDILGGRGGVLQMGSFGSPTLMLPPPAASPLLVASPPQLHNSALAIVKDAEHPTRALAPPGQNGCRGKPPTSPRICAQRASRTDAAPDASPPLSSVWVAAMDEAALVTTYEVQKATLLALSAAHELRALTLVLAMPAYEKDFDKMMDADVANATAQQAFWSPFVRGVLEAAAEGAPRNLEETEDVLRVALTVCEVMDRVRRDMTPMLRAMGDENKQGWSRSIQKHIALILQA